LANVSKRPLVYFMRAAPIGAVTVRERITGIHDLISETVK
jgi:hypothetical protein